MRSCCVAPETISSPLWWSMMEDDVRKRMYKYMCDWITLLYSRKFTEHCKQALTEKLKSFTKRTINFPVPTRALPQPQFPSLPGMSDSTSPFPLGPQVRWWQAPQRVTRLSRFALTLYACWSRVRRCSPSLFLVVSGPRSWCTQWPSTQAAAVLTFPHKAVQWVPRAFSVPREPDGGLLPPLACTCP